LIGHGSSKRKEEQIDYKIMNERYSLKKV